MTGGNGRHGRRDNGLYASDYAVLGDVDPRVGEHLLDVLGNRGIAAYLQPTTDQHPVMRLSTLQARPTDRLFVDRASAAEIAQGFLDELAVPEDVPADESAPEDAVATTTAPAARASDEFDQAWASIVAGYDAEVGTEERPWPASEDVATRGPSLREWPRWTPSAPPAPEPSLLDGLDTFGADLPDDEEDFVPPPPPPLPHLAPITILAILGIIAGFACVISPTLLPLFDPSQTQILGGAAMIGGAVALIGRLRSGDDDEPDDPDHGAVV